MEIKTSTGETNYNTNLASEYFIMGILCRTAKDAYLSLGNKKGVDIIVKTKLGTMCIVEVKGINKRNDWLFSNNKGEMVSLALFEVDLDIPVFEHHL